MAWYDLKPEPPKTKKEEKNIVLFKKFMEMNYFRVRKINEIISEPQENEQYRIITQQSFNGFSILLWLLEKDEYEEIYLSTFSLDEKTALAIVDLIKATPNIKYTLIITSLLKYDRKGRFNKLIDCAKYSPNFTFIEAFNHTKIIMAKSKTNYYVIEGSGNLSANARIEQYLFENSKATFNFHKSWMDDISQFSAKKDTIIH
ncbi:hypothetical protein ACFQ5N_02275 [Lutibacter holmesii]|uniref:PLD phosphodiesterase domain-containing protein n=1 Tax=Lutibacter holmesii TaxID=1137985 RepID=A0ABW3WLW9_9FLAO